MSLFNALTGDNTEGAHKKKETGFLGSKQVLLKLLYLYLYILFL